jgi:hypothetical protein
MARQRFVHPALWSDPDFGVITDSERILFVGLFSNADDEGRILASPAYLRALVWPYHERLTSARVRKLRDSLVGRFKSLQYYEIDGIEYIQFVKWAEYQKPKYPSPSKLPAPPQFEQTSLPLPGTLGESSGNGSALDWVGLGLDREGLGPIPEKPPVEKRKNVCPHPFCKLEFKTPARLVEHRRNVHNDEIEVRA